MTTSPFDGRDTALLVLTVEVLERLQRQEPDPERAALLAQLRPVRNAVLHGIDLAWPDGADAELRDAVRYLREVEATSLGTANARRVRESTDPLVVADVLLRSAARDRRPHQLPRPEGTMVEATPSTKHADPHEQVAGAVGTVPHDAPARPETENRAMVDHDPGTGGDIEHVVDSRRAGWRTHRETLRRELVEAAIRAVRRRGPGVGMAEIAAEARISKAVLYRHFADRTDLWFAVSMRAAELANATVFPALAGNDRSFRIVRDAVEAYVRFLTEYRQLYQFLELGRTDAAERRAWAANDVEMTDVLGYVVETVHCALTFPGDPASPGQSTSGVRSRIRSAIQRWLAYPDQTATEKVAEDLSKMIWNYLGAAPGVVGMALRETTRPQ